MSKDKNKTPTIYDVAKAAGVSPGTVSRTLNDTGYIKSDTREKIENVMAELKYIPNRAARSLKTKKTELVLLAIPDTDNPFYVDMIKAVQQISKFNGYSMILYYTEAKKNEEINALKMLREHFADGMILVNFSFTSEHLKEINRINHPLVLSGICTSSIGGNEQDRFDYIGVDTEKGMYTAAKHFTQQGHINIGYIGGVRKVEAFRERYRGYQKALISSGLKVNDDYVFWGNYSEISGYEAGKHFLQLKEPPTAVCAANDMLAMGALMAFEDSGIKVPDEISLIGMDNIETCVRLKPKLSSVSIAQQEIGRTAAELIFDRLEEREKGPSKKIIFEPRLVVRESSVVHKT